MQTIFHLEWPKNSFLFIPEQRFTDFINPMIQSRHLNPYNDHNTQACSNLFPLNYLLLLPFSWIDDTRAIFAYLFFAFTGWLSLVFVTLNAAGKIKSVRTLLRALAIVFCSYPFLFAFDRGNSDLLIGLMCGVGVLAWALKYNKTAALFFSLGAFAKGYPGILLVLLLADREYRAIMFGLFGGIIVNTLSIWIFSADQSIFLWLKAGLNEFSTLYVIGDGSMHYSSDLFNMIKLLYRAGIIRWNPVPFVFLFTMFSGFLACTAILVVTLWKNMPAWRKLCLLIVPAILFPLIANDYKTILLLIPVFALCLSADKWSPIHQKVLICLGLLLIPKHYYWIYKDASISCILNPILLLMVFFLALFSKPLTNFRLQN